MKFFIKAPPNSPIWGTAQDMLDYLEAWHDSDMITLKDLEGVTEEIETSIHIDYETDRSIPHIAFKHNLPERVVRHILNNPNYEQEKNEHTN